MFDAGGRPPSLAALTIPGKCPPFSKFLPFAASNSPLSQTEFSPRLSTTLYHHTSFSPNEPQPTPRSLFHIIVSVGWMQYGYCKRDQAMCSSRNLETNTLPVGTVRDGQGLLL
ncbi:hypothetical protein BO79DRAFT_206486 [Aspergillus costaricaensis CBS 115574]|uniref:Uncharacterized protein n=1 Tax=Aspergillus costaricaensis CBS 115574 TaxID=1448317 RepID=A0ACD1ITA4_9EURO|nr:hypothetical protein BO79DRAFT_206486 [Aspergillus costaricaensis CBS 115574]RAK93514.1 hypothetical protein BO79DRAFT_206486 [Aspergillus costaricaensis CBS 115574]